MAEVHNIADQPSATGLNLLSAPDLLLQERSQGSPFSTKTGIKSIDHQFRGLFASGRVIGLGQSQDDACLTLAPHLSVSALLEIADSRSTFKPRIFILAPPSTAIISSIHTLLRDRLKSLHLTTTLSAEPAAFELLDSVQVLQYLDLPGLAEALSEVSQRLFENGQIHATTDSGTGGSATENGPSGGSILLVQGLSTVLNSVQRRSGIVQTSAILSNLLRTIKHLSRIHHDLIVLVEADITTESPIAGERDLEAGQLDTAFSSATGTAMGVVPGGAVGSVIDRGTDVMVCVHDGFAMTTGDAKGKNRDGGHRSRTRVVEVVKDTMRGRLGEWCIWVQ